MASRLDEYIFRCVGGWFVEQQVRKPMRAMLDFNSEWFTGSDIESNS